MKPSPNFLILGRSGQLSRALAEACKAAGITYEQVGRDTLDLSRPRELKARVSAKLAAQPANTLIINTAAYTDVDKAETEIEAARQVNTAAPAIIAELAADNGLRLIHMSTDFVFSGQQERPWRETDDVSPLNVYGRTKRDGEIAVLAASPRNLVIRTSWLVSENDGNFLSTMVKLAASRKELSIVADQVGTPSSTHEVARAIVQIAGRIEDHEPGGLYHFSGPDSVSWFEFANRIFAATPLTVHTRAITAAEFAAPAPRPAYSALASEAAQERFDVRHVGLDQLIRDICGRMTPPA